MYRAFSYFLLNVYAVFHIEGVTEDISPANFPIYEFTLYVMFAVSFTLSIVTAIVSRVVCQIALMLLPASLKNSPWLSAPALLTFAQEERQRYTNGLFSEKASNRSLLPAYTPIHVEETFSGGKELFWSNNFTSVKPTMVSETAAMRELWSAKELPQYVYQYNPVVVKMTSTTKKNVLKNALPAPVACKPVIFDLKEREQRDLDEESEDGEEESDEEVDDLAAQGNSAEASANGDMDSLAAALSVVTLESDEGAEAMDVVPIAAEIDRVVKRKALVLDINSSPEELYMTRFTKSVKVYANSSVATGLAQFIQAETMVPYRCLGDFRLRKGRSAADQAGQERRRNAAIKVERAARISAALLNEAEMDVV
ncbi:hypothetical protein D9613_009256 [Agrocybe pediades]|uniref:Uncharacterized protein n=1 Tax=Agrocybe pediades TaxID=84607 RepID=A0A8H4R588_9AGAR|nr:hypothetical protein D9613_009256 [Agrocybe pediades]